MLLEEDASLTEDATEPIDDAIELLTAEDWLLEALLAVTSLTDEELTELRDDEELTDEELAVEALRELLAPEELPPEPPQAARMAG
jgi:hypothetical protein